MLVAELSTGEWGGIIAAIGTASIPIIAAIGGWVYKLRVENNKTTLQLEKVRAATAKIENTRLVKEQAVTIKEQATLLDKRSEEVHDARNAANASALTAAACEARMQTSVERFQAELKTLKDELTDCKEDRERLWSALGGKSTNPGSS